MMRMPINAWCTGSHKDVTEIPYGLGQCQTCNKIFHKLQKNGKAPRHRPRFDQPRRDTKQDVLENNE